MANESSTEKASERIKSFKEKLSNNQCPFCGKKLEYYQILLDLKAVGIITTATNAFARGKTPDLRPGVFGTLLDFAYAGLAQHLDGGFEI